MQVFPQISSKRNRVVIVEGHIGGNKYETNGTTFFLFKKAPIFSSSFVKIVTNFFCRMYKFSTIKIKSNYYSSNRDSYIDSFQWFLDLSLTLQSFYIFLNLTSLPNTFIWEFECIMMIPLFKFGASMEKMEVDYQEFFFFPVSRITVLDFRSWCL